MLDAMNKMGFFGRLVIAAAFAMLGGTRMAAGLDTEEVARTLAAQADVVALATCETTESYWDADHRVIMTRATVRPDRVFKGRADAALTVETLGGTVGSISMSSSHGAELQPGETAVLFLRRSRYGKHHVVWGGKRGKLAVRIGNNSRSLIGGGTGVNAETFAGWLEPNPE